MASFSMLLARSATRCCCADLPPRTTGRADLRKLTGIDWHRSNAATWQGRAIVGGSVSKNSANVLLTTATIRRALGLQLTPEESRAEEAFNRSRAEEAFNRGEQ